MPIKIKSNEQINKDSIFESDLQKQTNNSVIKNGKKNLHLAGKNLSENELMELIITSKKGGYIPQNKVHEIIRNKR